MHLPDTSELGVCDYFMRSSMKTATRVAHGLGGMPLGPLILQLMAQGMEKERGLSQHTQLLPEEVHSRAPIPAGLGGNCGWGMREPPADTGLLLLSTDAS